MRRSGEVSVDVSAVEESDEDDHSTSEQKAQAMITDSQTVRISGGPELLDARDVVEVFGRLEAIDDVRNLLFQLAILEAPQIASEAGFELDPQAGPLRIEKTSSRET